jgi:hypothetical protein
VHTCGIIDRDGGLINGFSFEEIRALFLAKTETNWLPNMIPFEEINQRIWSIG